VLAGAALGAGAGVKIWGVVPLLVVLGWVVLDRGWRPAVTVAAGAAGALTGICLPFFLRAPDTMIRMVVTDQLDRPVMHLGALARLYDLSSVAVWMPYSQLSVFVTAVLGLGAIGALVLAWQDRLARMVVVLLLAQTGLLLEAPSYFPAYAGFVVPAAALMLAAASGRIAASLAEHPMVLRVAAVAALSAAVAAAGLALVPIRVGSGRPFLGAQLGAIAGQQRCVLSDTPIVLIEMNVLSRDLRNGCPLHPDVTGYTYEGELALGPQDQVLARRNNPAWQKQALSYLTSGNAVLLARRRGTGLDHASMQTIKRWPVLARIDGYTLFARGPTS